MYKAPNKIEPAIPTEGYELDVIQVNGTAITGTTFITGSGYTIVTVTFKKQIYSVQLKRDFMKIILILKEK